MVHYKIPLSEEDKVKEIERLEAKIAQFEKEHPDIVLIHTLLQEYA